MSACAWPTPSRTPRSPCPRASTPPRPTRSRPSTVPTTPMTPRVWPRSSRPCRGSRLRWPCWPTRGWSPGRGTPASGWAGAPAAALQGLEIPLALFAHPRLGAKAKDAGIELAGGAVRVGEPVAYPEVVGAVQHAAAVVTDSGGLQKEAYLLGTPCTTVRSET